MKPRKGNRRVQGQHGQEYGGDGVQRGMLGLLEGQLLPELLPTQVQHHRIGEQYGRHQQNIVDDEPDARQPQDLDQPRQGQEQRGGGLEGLGDHELHAPEHDAHVDGDQGQDHQGHVSPDPTEYLPGGLQAALLLYRPGRWRVERILKRHVVRPVEAKAAPGAEGGVLLRLGPASRATTPRSLSIHAPFHKGRSIFNCRC